ncbi:MAG TPA: hypothetical protein VFZ78_03440 [Flavisolibacter sp.]
MAGAGRVSYAQQTDFIYPVLPATGSAIGDFIPHGWFVKDSAAGDLDGDGSGDLALVLEYRDTIPELRPDSSINEGSPRILAVYLGDRKSGSYTRFLQNNTFIIRYGEGGMDPEAYGEITINERQLTIFVSFIRGHATYQFCMQDGDLFLVRGLTGGVSGGTYYGFEADFCNRKAKVEEAPVDADKSTATWIRLTRQPLKRLRDMQMILQWEVVKDHFL